MNRSKVVECALRALKQAGIKDPNIDLFIGVFDGDVEAVKAALDAGADVNITDSEVIIAHLVELVQPPANEYFLNCV